MNKKLKATSLPGRPTQDVAPYEAAHRETAKKAEYVLPRKVSSF